MTIFNCLMRNIFVVLGWITWAGFTLTNALPVYLMDLTTVIINAGIIFLVMLGCVFAVTRHADHLAEMLKEPFGTLVLTLSIATVEVSLMLKIMLEGDQNPTMLRDTVFATLMIMLNGLIGLSLVAGGKRHFEQAFNLRGALSFLHLIAPLSLILLVMPNRTLSTEGPTLSPVQEIFLGVLCVVVYLVFLLMQTTRYKTLFDDEDNSNSLFIIDNHPVTEKTGLYTLLVSLTGLILAVTPIVLLAEELGHFINYGIETLHAPTALGGLIIAALVLTPEAVSAYRAAVANRMQRAVNISLGSALSSIAMTVPIIMLAAGLQNLTLTLGVDGGGSILLYATLFTILITLMSGKTTMLQGEVHLMLFFGYLLFTFYP